MARRINVRVEGGRKLRAFVKNMPEEARAQIMADLKRNMGAVVEQAKSRVPVDTGALKDALRLSVRKSRLEVRAGVVGNKGYVRLKGGGKRFYAKFVEFGTKKNAARPYLFPSWRQQRPKTLSDVKSGIRRAIRKAAMR